DERARVDEALTGAALDGRADRAEVDVDPRRRHGREARLDLRLGDLDGALARVVLLAGDRVRAEERLHALELGLAERELGPRLGEVRLGERELRLVGPRVDREEE